MRACDRRGFLTVCATGAIATVLGKPQWLADESRGGAGLAEADGRESHDLRSVAAAHSREAG